MVQLFSESFVLLYKEIYLKLDAPRALIIKFYTVPTNINSVTEEVDRLSQFSASSFFNFFLSIHHLNSTNASITCTWTFFIASFQDESDCLNHNFCESKKVNKNLVGKKKSNQSRNSVDQFKFPPLSVTNPVQICSETDSDYTSLQNRSTVSRMYFN